MNRKAHLMFYVLLSGFFLLIDQLLKYLARANTDFSYYLWKPWLGWEYFANLGIGFSLPVPNILVILVTPLIIFSLCVWGIKKLKQSPSLLTFFAFDLVVMGAISNFIDRIIFGITVDYLRVFTSIMNLADLMIMVGAIILIFDNRNEKNKI